MVAGALAHQGPAGPGPYDVVLAEVHPRVALRNSAVVPGQTVVLRPLASRYQLVQPPVFQTVRFIRSWTRVFQAPTAAGRGSSATRPPRTFNCRR